MAPAGHGHDLGRGGVDTGATAQDAYRLMLRQYIAPALRGLGFRRGPSLGAFRYETATHAAEVRFRKSRGSTRQDVEFWVDMHASDIKTEWVYWDWDLRSLAPELLDLWIISTGKPVGPVAGEVLRVFRSYGWPAIQAALDNPGYPARPHGPVAADVSEDSAGTEVRRRGSDERSRAEVEQIMGQADSDPRAFQALLARLETDPDPVIRQTAAWWLLGRASEESSRQALRAAAEDEDVEVRWIARYALRLADLATATRAASSTGLGRARGSDGQVPGSVADDAG